MNRAEVMRQRMERWIRERRLVAEHYSEDFVWDMTPAEWPGADEYYGTEGMDQFLSDWMATFDDWSYELEEVIEGEGGKVVVLGVQRGVNRGAGVPVEMRLAQVWTLDDDLRAVRMEMYTDRAAGLAAAGLR